MGPAVAVLLEPVLPEQLWALWAEGAHRHGPPDAESSSTVKPCWLLQGDFISGTA